MAEKKTVKKSAAIVTSELAKLRKLDQLALDKALAEAKQDLDTMKKLLKANELPSSSAIKQARAKVARIYTVATEKKMQKEAK